MAPCLVLSIHPSGHPQEALQSSRHTANISLGILREKGVVPGDRMPWLNDAKKKKVKTFDESLDCLRTLAKPSFPALSQGLIWGLGQTPFLRAGVDEAISTF